MIEVARQGENHGECRVCLSEIQPGQQYAVTQDGDADHFNCLDTAEQTRLLED